MNGDTDSYSIKTTCISLPTFSKFLLPFFFDFNQSNDYFSVQELLVSF